METRNSAWELLHLICHENSSLSGLALRKWQVRVSASPFIFSILVYIQVYFSGVYSYSKAPEAHNLVQLRM